MESCVQSSVEHRFGILLMSEPIIIPHVDIQASVEKYAKGLREQFKWECFQPSAPLCPGSEYRLCICVARHHLSELDCIQFIREQGGILPNLHGIFVALEKELLPKNNTCVVLSFDEKERLSLSGEHRVVPRIFCNYCVGPEKKNILQWQFWGAGIDKGRCIMFFMK